jgi:hypothetical protein
MKIGVVGAGPDGANDHRVAMLRNAFVGHAIPRQ